MFLSASRIVEAFNHDAHHIDRSRDCCEGKQPEVYKCCWMFVGCTENTQARCRIIIIMPQADCAKVQRKKYASQSNSHPHLLPKLLKDGVYSDASSHHAFCEIEGCAEHHEAYKEKDQYNQNSVQSLHISREFVA